MKPLDSWSDRDVDRFVDRVATVFVILFVAAGIAKALGWL